MDKQNYNELPMDDLSGKETPNPPEIRAEEENQTAAATMDVKKEK